MSKEFREIDKEDVSIQAPSDIAREIRVEAARRRTSISKLGSEALIRFLGRNPEDYGIETPKKQSAIRA